MKVLSRIVVAVVVFHVISAIGDAHETYQHVRIYIPNPSAMRTLASLGIALEEGVRIHEREIELIANLQEIKKLQESGFKFVVVHADMESFFRNRLSVRSADSFANGSMGGFYTLDETTEFLNNLRRQYNGLISPPIQIGSSVEGRPIFAYRVSDNADVNENEPEVLYTSLHHAREPQSLMTLLYFIEKLLQGYRKNIEITYLMNNRQMWFIPVVNPDGYFYNEHTNPNGGGLWRKNRNRNSDGTFGIDLNRNYGFKWGYDNLGSSPTPAHETYRGTAQFSEPETRAIRDFVKSRNFILTLNYHTFRDYLIYPWGYKNEETVHAPVFKEYASWMTRINKYGIGTSWETLGYLTNGEADDWFYGDVTGKKRILSLTPEVGGFSENFWPPQNRIRPLANENFQANLALAWLAGGYVITKQTKATESAGNGNDSIQPGEKAKIRITLRNMGYRNTMKNVTAQLRSLNPAASVSTSVEIFGDMKPFQNAEKSFDVAFARTANIDSAVRFEILISSQGAVLRKDFFSVKLQ
jgi:hypothetical protein